MPELPLLVFPSSTNSTPRRRGGGPDNITFPSKDRQIARVDGKINRILEQFEERTNFLLNSSISGIDTEQVFIIEIVGSVDNFKDLLDQTEGSEWLFEWDITADPDDDFYNPSNQEKKLSNRLFLSMNNQRGLDELLGYWNMWKKTNTLPWGKAKWKEIFSHIKDIRPWGVQEQLEETGIKNEWIKELEIDSDEPINFEIELFYRRNPEKRRDNEQKLKLIMEEIGGRLISSFLDIEEIHFHSVKVELPRDKIREIVERVDNGDIDFLLLKFPNIMYFRTTGQALSAENIDNENFETTVTPELNLNHGSPVIAILDGVPLYNHELLKDRILLDDPDDYESAYQPGERKHGTSIASLIIHGDINAHEDPLDRPIYLHPIMKIDEQFRGFGKAVEYVPDDIFLEDKIYRAVRRMFEGEGTEEAQAENVKIINLSIGDTFRPFNGMVSPLARLIDYLSWRYKVLFNISAGNYKHDYDFGLNEADYKALPDEEKIELLLKYINSSEEDRKIISPAESINGLTVGAVHKDESTYTGTRLADIQKNDISLPSSINRLGLGLRNTVKPEIFFAGGRQLYDYPIMNGHPFKLLTFTREPGQQAAYDDSSGSITKVVYTSGTSNATALATRAGAKIYDVVKQLQADNPDKISDSQIAIIIKALLVHGASKDTWFSIYENHLREGQHLGVFKACISKFLGYGEVNVSKVLSCTEQRATIIGTGGIREGEAKEYRIPLPPSLANENAWRRLTITLAWFTPINPNHRNLRKAQLYFTPPNDTDDLGLSRQESDWQQVRRGTVQHEVLEGTRISNFQDGDFLVVLVQCHADAVSNLDEEINYALAVTLEVKEDVALPIYDEIRARIQLQIQV